MIPRTAILAIALGLSLGSCASKHLVSATTMYVTVELDGPDGPAWMAGEYLVYRSEVASERRQDCERMVRFCRSEGVRVSGAALPIDMPEGKFLIVLLAGRDGDWLQRQAERVTGDRADACAQSQEGCVLPEDQLPYMAVFSDALDPRSARMITPGGFEAAFGKGNRLSRVSVRTGGAAKNSTSCFDTEFSQTRIKRVLPFTSILDVPDRPTSDDRPPRFGEVVQDRASYLRDAISCDALPPS